MQKTLDILDPTIHRECDCPPVLDESMWDVNPLQVRSIVLWYAEKVQVIALLLITDLKLNRTQRG